MRFHKRQVLSKTPILNRKGTESIRYSRIKKNRYHRCDCGKKIALKHFHFLKNHVKTCPKSKGYYEHITVQYNLNNNEYNMHDHEIVNSPSFEEIEQETSQEPNEIDREYIESIQIV